ncbi:transaldolase family protein [Deltaproteobacteria bacterium TL4]
MTVVVADTGDIESIKHYKPQDATTNPSLIYKASQMEKYANLLDEARVWATKEGGTPQVRLENAADKLFVNFGIELLKIIPGRVSTDGDVRLPFDTEGTIQRTRKLISVTES